MTRASRASFRLRAALVAAALVSVAGTASAQMGRPGGMGGGMGGGGQNKPTQSSPTQNKTIGPRSGQTDAEEEEAAAAQRASVLQRGDSTVAAPSDPLEVTPEVAKKIGSDADGAPPPPAADAEMHRSWFPYYQEQKADYRLRLLPPFLLEHTRGLGTKHEDTEGLYGSLYYRRRSLKLDMDVLFPLAWRVRDRDNHVFVLGPIAHREAPHEHDNWLAPIFFEGERADGGYFHALPLLTTSHWSAEKAFTYSWLYFRDRTGSDVDMGVVPFYFHGDNGNRDGARNRYTLIPPLLYFHRVKEIDESSTTVVGPVIAQDNPKRSILDVAPFYWSIRGKPQSGGVMESHTTLFPFFHYGVTEKESLFVLPFYLRRVTPTVDTMLTPFYSRLSTRSNSASTEILGPILPLYYHRHDKDLGLTATGVFPFYFGSHSPTNNTLLTPLFGRFESPGVSRTYWTFPSLVVSQDLHGWEGDFHPLVYVGRHDDASHTVIAPFFWDFAKPTGRTTIGFPFYWRFADTTDASVTQVAANTVYLQKRVPGGLDWQFHLLPLFSIGETPQGKWWNVLFGLAGYERAGSYSRIKAFWIPITVSGSAPATDVASEPHATAH